MLDSYGIYSRIIKNIVFNNQVLIYKNVLIYISLLVSLLYRRIVFNNNFKLLGSKIFKRYYKIIAILTKNTINNLLILRVCYSNKIRKICFVCHFGGRIQIIYNKRYISSNIQTGIYCGGCNYFTLSLLKVVLIKLHLCIAKNYSKKFFLCIKRIYGFINKKSYIQKKNVIVHNKKKILYVLYKYCIPIKIELYLYEMLEIIINGNFIEVF